MEFSGVYVPFDILNEIVGYVNNLFWLEQTCKVLRKIVFRERKLHFKRYMVELTTERRTMYLRPYDRKSIRISDVRKKQPLFIGIAWRMAYLCGSYCYPDYFIFDDSKINRVYCGKYCNHCLRLKQWRSERLAGV